MTQDCDFPPILRSRNRHRSDNPGPDWKAASIFADVISAVCSSHSHLCWCLAQAGSLASESAPAAALIHRAALHMCSRAGSPWCSAVWHQHTRTACMSAVWFIPALLSLMAPFRGGLSSHMSFNPSERVFAALSLVGKKCKNVHEDDTEDSFIWSHGYQMSKSVR